jgi:hypothetical protein
MQKIQGMAKNSMVWGWVILFFSFGFGFYGYWMANFTGPLNEINLGNVNVSIAYFGLTILWGILGAMLVIFGGVMTVIISNMSKVVESTPKSAKENVGKPEKVWGDLSPEEQAKYREVAKEKTS